MRQEAKLLLQHTPDDIYGMTDDNNSYILGYVAFYPWYSLEEFRRIISLTPDKGLENADCTGNNALHFACHHQPAEIVSLFLEMLPRSARSHCNDNGQTPLDVAKEKGNAEVIALFNPTVKAAS